MREVKKPWGSEKHFVFNGKCTVKLLTVNPKQELSLQSHKHREEDWYFLDSAKVQVGNRKFKVKEGDYIKVKKGQKHRVAAENKTARFIEISFGKFDQNDETRYGDKYGRK